MDDGNHAGLHLGYSDRCDCVNSGAKSPQVDPAAGKDISCASHIVGDVRDAVAWTEKATC